MSRLLDRPWPYFVGAALLLVVAVATQFEYSLPARPAGTIADVASLPERDDLNVVYIVIDTLRSDHVGAYGYERNATPNIDQLARYGIRFADVISQSAWTKASMASMWTSTYPSNNQILRFNDVIPDEALLGRDAFWPGCHVYLAIAKLNLTSW